MHCYVGHKICLVLTFSVYVQFPRVRDTSFTGVTVEECRVLLSGMETHFILCSMEETHIVPVNILSFYSRECATDG